MDGARRFDRLFPLVYAVVYVAAALAIQLAWFPIGDLGTESDFYGDFVIAAQRLWAGEFTVQNYPFKGPIYSFALTGVYAVVSLLDGDWYRSGVILNLICAAAFIVLNYRLLLRGFGRRAAVCATVGTSLVFEMFLHAHKATSDLLFLLLCTLAVERLSARGWTWRRLALAGALGGLAFLTRYNGLIVPLAGFLIVLVVNRDRRSWRPRLLGAAAHLAGVLIVIAPWYAVNYAETGRLLATRGLQNIFVEELHDASVAAAAPETLADVIRHDPGRVAGRYLANVPDHLRRDLGDSLNGHLTILLVLGVSRLLLFPPRRRHWAFLVFPLLYFLAMCAVYYQPRFTFAAWPGWFVLGFAVLAGDGVNRPGRLGERLMGALSWHPPRATGFVLLSVVALTVFTLQISDIVIAEREYHRRLPRFALDLAPELKRLAGGEADVVLMARKPHLAHYAGMTYLQYPPVLGDADDFLDFASVGGVRFVVVGPVERGHYPERLYLTELSRYAGVERVYHDDETTVYELDPDLDAATPVINEVTVDLERRLTEARIAGAPIPIFQLNVLAAEARARDGDWETAAEHLESGLAALPASDQLEARKAIASALLNLARTYLKLGRNAEGIALLEPALREIAATLTPGHLANAQACLARLYEHLGNLDEAERYLSQAHNQYLTAGEPERAADMRRHLESLR